MIRIFDIFGSLIGLLFISPLLLAIAIWILMDSKGPVFYKQNRVGKNGKDFKLYKFRSMFIGSDQKGLLTIGGKDSRITKSGNFIRKYKIDELPQLINVLRGEMSLVGPRPEVRKYVNLYNNEQLKVLSIKPGITDLASIKYVDENEILENYDNPENAYLELIMPDKISLNMQYINNYNLVNYFKILFLTVKSLLFR